MRQRAWTTRGALLVAGVCGAVLLTACGGEQFGSEEASPAASATSATSATASATKSTAAPLEVTDKAARNLCDMMRPELTNWRIQGPTIGKIGLNAMVHEWAFTNGQINAQVLADKSVVDQVSTETCPDVHSEAVRALEIPDLASALAF